MAKLCHLKGVNHGKWPKNDLPFNRHVITSCTICIVETTSDQETSVVVYSYLHLAYEVGILGSQTIPASMMIMCLTCDQLTVNN